MIEVWEIVRETAVAWGTIILAIATVVLAVHTAGLRKSTDRMVKQAIWQNEEDHYQRLMVQGQEPPSAMHLHAVLELITLAEEWGEGRRRAAVRALFMKLADEEEERRKLPGWEQSLSTRAVLRTWERHGVDYNLKKPLDGVDEARERKAGLVRRFVWTFKTWWHERHESAPEVPKTNIKDGIEKMRAGMALSELRMRATGGRVFAHELGWAKPGEVHALRRIGETDWEEMEATVHGGRWVSVIGSMHEPETNRPGVRVQATGAWSASKPEGEWQIEVEVRTGIDVRSSVWEWRGEAPKWMEGTDPALRELESATSAAIERWHDRRR